MGFIEGTVPPVDPKTFKQLPYRERIKALSQFWVDYGFGAPKVTVVVYLAKLLVLHGIGGILIATLTSGYSPFSPSEWWDQIIIWQKLVIWTMLLETLGLAGAWGPLCGHFKPMTGGIRYWAKPKTIRLPPWPEKIPGTKGTERTPLDVALYLGFLVALGVALFLPGSPKDGTGPDTVAMVPLVVALVLLGLIGLRDKTIFLASRVEQYAPALIFFAFFPLPDMIIAAKVLIVIVWVGAAFSKIGHHFSRVVAPMVSNTPWILSKKLKRAHYRDYPNDLRPSKQGVRLAHVGGTLVEAGMPLILLFSQNSTLTAVAVVVMIGFHVFIISTFPLAVPLEWNLLFIYITLFLFIGHPAQDGFALTDMDPTLLAITLVGLLFFPILGNMRPDLVSFLPSMRQYAGNWASGMWAHAPGTEQILNEKIVKPALMQRQQLGPIYGEDESDIIMYQFLGWRSLHSQGPGLNSVMMNQLGDDIDVYDLREAEFSCNAIIGFNFGEGHLHRQTLIEAIQERCQFKPGEFIVAWVESEAFGAGYQNYWVMDAAVGIVERGTWSVKEATDVAQPWLPDGPIGINVKWRLKDYQRVSYGANANGVAPRGDQPPSAAEEVTA